MKSVKPGRGPSFMGGFGSVAAILFGVFWTIMAASMGAPVFFPLFGVVFIVLGIVQAVYHFNNATGTNRFSTFDITDGDEEPDPLDPNFHNRNDRKAKDNVTLDSEKGNFCPYCGSKIKEDFMFCKQCGKEIS